LVGVVVVGVALAGCHDRLNITPPPQNFVGPTIDSVVVYSLPIVIESPSLLHEYTVTVSNPVSSFSNVTMTARILQSGADREAFLSRPVNCGRAHAVGILPIGRCSFESMLMASNAGEGTGTLQPGVATLEIRLANSTNGLLATRTWPITLHSGEEHGRPLR